MRIVVGEGSCGIAAGAGAVYAGLEKYREKVGFSLGITGCVGMCFVEPIVDIYDGALLLKRLVRVSPEDAADIAEYAATGDNAKISRLEITAEDSDFLEKQTRIALRRCGIIDPESIDDYISSGGYGALKKVLTEMTPEEVIAEIKTSGLAGRGGAGFPTWFKWDAARKSEGSEKYLICNADEGDPGAFMDRAVIESDPHSLIEGMLIAAYAIGAENAFVYVRAEYPLAIERLKKAIAAAEKKGLLGKNILGTSFSCGIRIKAGAGAFVCGERTADYFSASVLLAFKFYVDYFRVGIFDEIEEFIKRRQRRICKIVAEIRAEVEFFELPERIRGYIADTVGGVVYRIVVADHQFFVFREMHIGFKAVRSLRYRLAKGRQRVLRSFFVGASVRNYLYSHITNPSCACLLFVCCAAPALYFAAATISSALRVTLPFFFALPLSLAAESAKKVSACALIASTLASGVKRAQE